MLIGTFIVIAIVLAIALVVLGRRSSSRRVAAAPAEKATAASRPRPDDDLATFHLEPTDFHVDGDTAIVSFDVDAARVEGDDVLKDLLARQAIEAVHERQARHLPIGDIARVVVHALEGSTPVAVVTTELEEPGRAVFPDAHDAEMKDADEVDPLQQFAEAVSGGSPGEMVMSRRDDLPDLASELRLSSGLEAAMRNNGVDPAALSATTLTKELLRIAGYTLAPGATPGTFLAGRAGVETFVSLVDHEPGQYPELSEQAINSFLAGFYSSRAERGLLFSDKFCPHLVYEKERRDKRVRFITRERLQDFVDSIAAL